MNAAVLSDVLQNEAPGHRGAQLGHCSVKGPIHEASHCSIYFAECSNLPGPAAVKVCRSGPERIPDPLAAAEQYEALTRIEAAWQRTNGQIEVAWQRTKGLQCVHPYALFKNQAIVVLEWVPGRSLGQIMLALRTSAPKASELASQAGRWLSAFHHLGRKPARPMDAEQKRPIVESMYGWQGAQNPAFRRSVDSLLAALPEAASTTVEHSWTHGDFKMDNLLVEAECLTGIDVHLRHNNAVVYDLGSFLNHMELSCLDPRNPWRMDDRDRLATHFLEGYCEQSSRPPVSALTWCRMFQLLCNWNSVLERSAGVMRRTLLHWAFASTAARLRQQLGA